MNNLEKVLSKICSTWNENIILDVLWWEVTDNNSFMAWYSFNNVGKFWN